MGSELSDKYAVAFEGMEMETRDGDTILTGRIIDQPQLFGILERINDAGIEAARACRPCRTRPTRSPKGREAS